MPQTGPGANARPSCHGSAVPAGEHQSAGRAERTPVRFCTPRRELRGGGAGSRVLWLPAALLLSVFSTLAVLAPAAGAAIQHESLEALSAKISEGVPAGATAGGEPAVTGPLQAIPSMTVDGGELWVADQFSGQQLFRVDSFDDGSGAWGSQMARDSLFESPFGYGLAVGHSTGEREVYVSVEEREVGSVVSVLGPAGEHQASWTGGDTPEGSFGGEGRFASGLASDESGALSDWASGDVYVAVTPGAGANYVDVFKPQANGGEEYVTQITSTEVEAGKPEPLGRVRGVAVDQGNGDLFVATDDATNHAVVSVFEPVEGMEGVYRYVTQIGETAQGPLEPEVPNIAVDSGSHTLYVATSHEGVFQFALGAKDESIVYAGRLTGPHGGSFASVGAVAVDSASHDVYVADYQNEEQKGTVDVFGPSLVVPDVVTGPASGVGVESATLNGTINPLEAETGEAAECQFEWDTSASFEGSPTTTPCAQQDLKGSSPVTVSATLTSKLQPDTRYYYRLQASNANGLNEGVQPAECEGAPAPVACFTTPGPGIGEVSATDVAASSATLNATIDPDGAPTSYYFQYGTSTSYEHQAPAAPGLALGSTPGAVAVSPQHVNGLLAGTVYHYRVVAVSELEAGKPPITVAGPDETFTTQTGSGSVLPDGRAWEMVSPPNKNGALIEPIGQEGLIQAAANGEAITFHSNQPMEKSAAGYANQAQALATRGPGGWQTRDIEIPNSSAVAKSEGVGETYRFFSEDLSAAVLNPQGAFTPLAPQATEQTAYLRDNTTGTYLPLVTRSNDTANPFQPFGEEGVCPLLEAACGPQFLAASRNGAHIILDSNVQLTETPLVGGALYEWSEGNLSLVSKLPSGVAAGRPDLGRTNDDTRFAVSDDGSRVFWEGENHLYMTDMAHHETLMLDAVQGGSGASSPFPEFNIASSNGTKVFFADGQSLLPGAGGTSNKPSLFECAIVRVAGKLQCRLTNLTPAQAGANTVFLGGVLGASEDGETVYFVSDDRLAPGAVHGSCDESSTTHGALCNLYMRRDGITKLVAVIGGEDQPTWGIGIGPFLLEELTSRVSPDGNWLAFMSNREITGYDNHDAVSGAPDEEVYLYNAATGRLRCASCNPTGARPHGARFVAHEAPPSLLNQSNAGWLGWLAALLPAWTSYANGPALYQSRYLSNSGRLFFNSDDGLMPRDVNGTWDVYEYEPAGVPADEHACATNSATYSPVSEGCVGLISSGGSGQESAFLDASESGGDVFFLTTAQLASQDFDHAYDVYDAHECTVASPCVPPGAAAPGECVSAEACRAAPSPQPGTFGAPSSATFSGAGNLVPTAPLPAKAVVKKVVKCRKGLVRNKRGKCVKKPKKRARRARKSNRRGK